MPSEILWLKTKQKPHNQAHWVNSPPDVIFLISIKQHQECLWSAPHTCQQTLINVLLRIITKKQRVKLAPFLQPVTGRVKTCRLLLTVSMNDSNMNANYTICFLFHFCLIIWMATFIFNASQHNIPLFSSDKQCGLGCTVSHQFYGRCSEITLRLHRQRCRRAVNPYL